MRKTSLALLPLLWAGAASADPPRVQLKVEAGSEVDTNPHRQTTEPGVITQEALVWRGASRFSLSWRPASRRLFRASALVAGKKFYRPQSSVEDEDVAIVAGDLRFDAALDSRPLALGARLSFYEAIERDTVDRGVSLDNDFATADGSFVLSLLGDDDQRVVASAGYRLYQYKPNDDFNFAGEHVGLAYTRAFSLAASDDDPEPATIDLGVEYAVHRRAYAGQAKTNLCADDAIDTGACISDAGMARADLFHVGAVELAYSGHRLAGLRYELHVNDSNSFGQSLIRHRLELSGTTETWWSVYVTAKATVQLIQFVDPLLLSIDVGLLTIEDENRNSLVLHATRDFGDSWSAEARFAWYSNEFATQELLFERVTLYGGLVYAFDSGR